MTDNLTGNESAPILFTSLHVDKETGHLYGVDGNGREYPFYVFTPLREAVTGQYGIAVAPQWPQYAVDFVLEYLPVPSEIPPPYPEGITLGVNERPDDKERPWPQAKYHGWPLYYVAGHHGRGHRSDHPAMFQPASVDLEPLPTDAAYSQPGPFVGP